MLNLLLQFFLLLYWRYHNKMLYWEPCFLFLGARTKKHRSLTPKENSKKKIGEISSIEAFFAVQFSHKPERVLKIRHANTQKNRPKKLGLPPKTGYNLSSETTPPPPPPPKKINPNFFLKKAMLNYYFIFFCFYIDVIIIKCSIERPASFVLGPEQRNIGH